MNGHGESDRVIVPEKPPNKEEMTGEVSVNESAEEVEERTLAKENSRQQNTRRTQSRECVHSALTRVRRAASSGSTLTSEAGAQCGSSARWDLCGGRPVRAVPTAPACIPSNHKSHSSVRGTRPNGPRSPDRRITAAI